MKRIAISLFSILLTLLMGLSTTLAPAYATEPASDAARAHLAPQSQLAYMDFSLTTSSQSQGGISVDEAFSLYFRSDATADWDRYDASKLLPRGDTWAAIAFEGTKGGDDILKAQESRPYSDTVQVVDVKIIQKNMPAATYTINVQQWYSVPSNWSLRLQSEALDTTFVIDDASDTITFQMGASSQKASRSPDSSLEKSSPDTTHVKVAGEVGPEATALPVEMTSFSANANDNDAVLQWETASETNNSGFAVQHRRSGADFTSSNWSKIGFVRGHGTTNQPQTYRFKMSSIDPGTHHFRLKQIDRDGTTHYTESVKLVRKPSGRIELTTAPNPFAEQVTVALTPRSSQSVRIQLVDMLGRVVKDTGPKDLSANVQTHVRLAGSRLAAGSYLLRIDGETFTETERIVRVR